MVAIKLKVLLCNAICTCTSEEVNVYEMYKVNVYEMYKANVHEVNISPSRQHLLKWITALQQKGNLTKKRK